MPRGRILLVTGLGGAGRILGSPPPPASRAAPAVAAGAQAASPLQWALILTLPMFGQVFHYVIDLPPLYFLSKAWPVLAFPLALVALFRLAPPYRLIFAAVLTYTVVVGPTMSMIYFGNQPFDALATTAKAWPLSYYFAVLGALALWRCEPRLLERSLFYYGIATWLLLWSLWLIVPHSHYSVDPRDTRLFLFDVERGYRIYMPLFFGTFALFYALERLLRRPSLGDLTLILVALAALPIVFKQRTYIAVVLLVLLWIIWLHLRGPLRSLVLVGGALAGLVLAAVVLERYGAVLFESLGASLTIRLDALALASEFLVADPLRWILGVGSITRFSEVTLFDIFGTHHFYLADLGWAGILFEYGVIGTLLIAGVYLAGLREALRGPGVEAPPVFEAALAHLALFLVLVTVIYPPMYAPGELATTLALLVYLRLRRGLLQAGRPATLG